jgi:hypothetical protein
LAHLPAQIRRLAADRTLDVIELADAQEGLFGDRIGAHHVQLVELAPGVGPARGLV